MKNRLKKFACALFMVLITIDICDIIRYFVDNEDVRLDRFLIYKFEFSSGEIIYSISMIYFFVVSTIYFFINFFKNSDE